MRFPGKKTRAVAKRGDIDFDHYDWDAPKERGWHPLVVLNGQEKTTKTGDPMGVIDFGVDLPDGTGARIRWHVPYSFPPKVQMLMEVLLPEYLESEEDVDIDLKILFARECVGLIDIDEEYQRDDGEPSWKLMKIIRKEDAERELGADWTNARAGRDVEASDAAEAEDAAEADVLF